MDTSSQNKRLFSEKQQLIPRRYHRYGTAIILFVCLAFGLYNSTKTGPRALITAAVTALVLYSMWWLLSVPKLVVIVSTNKIVYGFTPLFTDSCPRESINSVLVLDKDPGNGIGIKRLKDGSKQYRLYGKPVRINKKTGEGIIITLKNPELFRDSLTN